MNRSRVLLVLAGASVAAAAVLGLRARRGDAPPSEAPASVWETTVAEPALAGRTLPPAPDEARVTKGDIAGTVVDGKDVPVARVRITALADLEPSRPGHMLSDPRGIAISDEEGRFTVRGLTPGSYVLEARGEDVVPTTTLATTEDADVKIELVDPPPSSAPSVRVLDAAGHPLRGALVTLGGAEFPNGRLREVSDAEGRVRFPPADLKGIHGLYVKPPPDRPDLQPLLVADWTRRDDTLRLEPARPVRGRVIDTEGRPVSRADVFHASGNAYMERQALDTTDREGRFQVPRLPAGTRLRLFARPSWIADEAANSAIVDAVAGDQEVVLVIDVGVDLTVKVEGAAEARSSRAVAARETAPGGNPHEELIRADGVVTFRGLRRDATYAVWIPPGTEGGPCGYATGQRGSDATSVIRLSPSLAVEGRLLADGAIRDGQVFLQAPAIQVDASVAEDGAFRVGGLPAARLRLFSSVWMRGGRWIADGEVAAGTRVELSLKPVR